MLQGTNFVRSDFVFMNRPALLISVLFCICIAALAGCGGNKAPVVQDQSSTGFDLSGPQQMLELLRASRHPSYLDQDLVRLGREYEEELPHQNVTVLGNYLKLEPEWTEGGGLEGAAFCIYSYVVPDFDLDPEVNFDFFHEPDPPQGLYMGLSNWDDNRWDWYEYSGSEQVKLQDMGPYFDEAGNLLAVLVAVSEDYWEMLSMRLGPVPPSTDWYHTAGLEGSEELYCCAADSLGSVYGAGKYLSPEPGPWNEDGILVKYDRDGQLIWARAWSLPDGGANEAIAVSPDGNIYVAGWCVTESNGMQSVVQKWTSDGELLWTRTWGGPDTDDATGVTATSDAVYVVGESDLGGEQWYELTVHQFSTDGELLAAKRFGDIYADSATAIAQTHTPGGELELHIVGQLGNGQFKQNHNPLYLKLDEDLNLLAAAKITEGGILIWDVTATSDSPPRVFATGSGYSEESGHYTVGLVEVVPSGSAFARNYLYQFDGAAAFGICSPAPGRLAISGTGDYPRPYNRGFVIELQTDGTFIGGSALLSADDDIRIFGICSAGDERVAAVGDATHCSNLSWEKQWMQEEEIICIWEPVVLDGGDLELPVEINSDPATEIDGWQEDNPDQVLDTVICRRMIPPY